MKNQTYCVIMAGGGGTRFWPVSRTSRPKQFLDMLGTGKTFLRSTFDTLWTEEFAELDATCRHRFRTPTDLSQWLVRYEQLVTGRFTPVGMRDTLLTKLSDEDTEAIADALLSDRYAMICINDNNDIRHPEQVRATLEEAFRRLLPDRCAYERH